MMGKVEKIRRGANFHGLNGFTVLAAQSDRSRRACVNSLVLSFVEAEHRRIALNIANIAKPLT